MTKISQTEILELLNANKNNLSVLKDMNIISEYFKLLGAEMWVYETATDNDILLPEIEDILKYYNYNCRFTKSGIFVGTEKILSYENDNIYWKKGKNTTVLCGRCYYTGNTIGYRKNITDFTALSESEMSNISSTARLQIEFSENNCDMALKEIIIFNTITSGVEVSKKVMEEYQSKENKEDWVDIYQTIAYSPNNSTINYDQKIITAPHIQSHIGEYIEKYRIPYTMNPSLIGETKIEQPNYGGKNLVVYDCLCQPQEMKYDYNNLYINLMNYHQIHPLEFHPIFIYANKYPDFTKKYLQELSDDFAFYAKMITSSTDSENTQALIENFRQYRSTHPYEIHPKFFLIANSKNIDAPNPSIYEKEKHFKNLCKKK